MSTQSGNQGRIRAASASPYRPWRRSEEPIGSLSALSRPATHLPHFGREAVSETVSNAIKYGGLDADIKIVFEPDMEWLGSTVEATLP
jgi:hypothetical protein